jgi:hypothetical protein
MDQDEFQCQASKLMNEAETSTKLHDWGQRENVLNTLAIIIRYSDFLKINELPVTYGIMQDH